MGPYTAGGDGGNDKMSWDAGRFVQTVLFFNPPPTPQQVVENLLSPFTAFAGSQNKAAPSPSSISSSAGGANPPPVFAIDEAGRAVGMVRRCRLARLASG